MPRLVITKGTQQGTELRVDGEVVIFGRLDTCDVTLEDTKSSRRHAQLVDRGGYHEIEDLGSANGTQVNGRPVKKQRLYGGDVITIGTTEIRYQQDTASRKPRSTAAPAGGGPGTGASPSAATASPEDIQIKSAPLQFSKYKDTGSGSFLKQDILQEGGLLRTLLIVGGFLLMAAIAIGTALLTRGMF